MSKKITKSGSKLLDIIAFLLAVLYIQSVLTVAHHTSQWIHDGTARIVESPATGLLIIALLMSGYSWYRSGIKKPSTLITITLTILATASLFWLSGLRTNFYF